MCNLCQSYESETVSHFLFRCCNSEIERTKLWKEIQLLCPPTVLMELINTMNDDIKSTFLITKLDDSLRLNGEFSSMQLQTSSIRCM